VSWGFGCGYPSQYGVYARIGDHELYDWITGHVGPPAVAGPPPAPSPTPAALPELRVATVKHRGRRLILRVAATAPVARVRVRLLRRGVVVARGARTGAGRIVLRVPRGASGRFRLEARARDAVAASRTVKLG
jgi:hypothetical protein